MHLLLCSIENIFSNHEVEVTMIPHFCRSTEYFTSQSLSSGAATDCNIMVTVIMVLNYCFVTVSGAATVVNYDACRYLGASIRLVDSTDDANRKIIY